MVLCDGVLTLFVHPPEAACLMPDLCVGDVGLFSSSFFFIFVRSLSLIGYVCVLVYDFYP